MNNEMGGYYAVIPSYVLQSADLKPNDKIMYGQISALTNSKGYCWATNKRLGEMIGVKADTASKLISHLEEADFIVRKVIRNEQKQVIKRYLMIKQPTFSGVDPDDGQDDSDESPIAQTSTTPKGQTSDRGVGQTYQEKLKGLSTTTPDQDFDPIAETKRAVYTEHPLAFYQRTWGKSANGILNMEISNLANKYGNQLVNYAFYLAGSNGNPYSYAKKGLLDNWAKDGLDTIQKVADNRAQYQAKRKQRRLGRYTKPQNNVTPIDTHQTTLNDRIRSVYVNCNGDINAVIQQFAVDEITVTAEQIRGVMNERA